MAWSLSETQLVRANVVATGAPQTTDASNLSAGILADARLSSSVARSNRTGLVGGGGTNLDGITTAGLGGVAPIQGVAFTQDGYYSLSYWQLRATITAATNDIENGVVVPVDYNAGTNNFLWYRVSRQIDPPTFPRTAVADTAYTILNTDRWVALTSITTARIFTLPLANTFPPGATLLLQDESGSITGTNSLTVATAGGDLILGVTLLKIPRFGSLLLRSNGVSKWIPVLPERLQSVNLVDANATLVPTQTHNVQTVALTAPRTRTLPPASQVPAGIPLVFVDPSGFITSTNTATIGRAGSDTINGGTSLVINKSNQVAIFYSDSISAWTASVTSVSSSSIAATKLPLKGDNAGGAIAEAVQQVGNVTTATIAVGTDVILLTTTLTANLTLTLPALSGMPAGHRIEIRDGGGFVSTAFNVLVIRAGSDTVNGVATAVTVLNRPRGTAFVTAGAALTDWGAAVAPNIGSIAGAAAGAGTVGEVIFGNLAPGSAVGLTTGVVTNVLSISLTPGEWEVSAIAGFKPAVSCATALLIATINNVSATLGSDDRYVSTSHAMAQTTAGTYEKLSIPPTHFSLTATTTIFLVVEGFFTVAALAAFGTLRAIRTPQV